MTTDRIEKKIELHASQSRVWRALTDSKEFGSWFGMKLEGPFVAGKTIRGAIAQTTVDPAVAELQKPHVGKAVELVVDRIEPEWLFSFRWHPAAVDEATDFTQEPMTLVTFTLEPRGDTVLLTITESGFDQLPAARRAEALESNEGGWAHQMRLIERYLALHAA